MKAEAVGAVEAALDYRELERELWAVQTRGEFDRQALESELRWTGPEGAAAAWQRVDAGLRAERAGLERIRDELPDPLDVLSWASELCQSAARWRAWEVIRLRGEGEGSRPWSALHVAAAELQEELVRSRNGRGDPRHGDLTADCWTVALNLVIGEVRELVGAHSAAVAALYARAQRAHSAAVAALYARAQRAGIA
jgi:hypothetical protein